MKAAIIIFSVILLMSCASREKKGHAQKDLQAISAADMHDTLRQLFLKNASQINAICDSIININNANDKKQVDHSVWISTGTAFTAYASNILGTIAAKAGDSSECIVVEVTVYNVKSEYNTPNQKNNISITAADASCIDKLNRLTLKPDSTERFTFGVNRDTLNNN